MGAAFQAVESVLELFEPLRGRFSEVDRVGTPEERSRLLVGVRRRSFAWRTTSRARSAFRAQCS